MRLHLRPKLALPVAALALAVAGAALSPAASSAPAVGTSARQTPGTDAIRAQAASGKPVNLDWPRPGGTLVDGGLMVAHPGTWTGARPIAFTYEWKWCYGGELDDWCIPAGSGPRYFVVRQVPPLLRLVVTATNSAGQERMTMGLGPLGEPQIPPFLADPPRLFGIPKVGELLEATEGIWYAPASTQFTFHWWRCTACQAPIELAADPPGSNQYLVTAADAGSSIYADVKADPVTPPGQAICCPATNTLFVAPALAPEPLAKPTIQGPSPPRVGDLLTATDGEWAGAQPMTFTYTWYGCFNVAAWNIPLGCNPVGHAKSYIPTPADVGGQLAVSVGAYNAYGFYGQTSNATEPVQPAGSGGSPPVNSSPPTISGTPQVGNTLQASPGSWSGDQPITFAYQWRSCTPPTGSSPCEDIPGAGGVNYTTYVVQPADVGQQLAVHVTATNPAGSGQKSSAETAPVQNNIIIDEQGQNPPGYYFGRRFLRYGLCCGGKRIDGSRASISVSSISPDSPSCINFATDVSVPKVGGVFSHHLETGIAKCGSAAANPCSGPGVSGLYLYVERTEIGMTMCLAYGAVPLNDPHLFSVTRTVSGTEDWRAYIDGDPKLTALDMYDYRTIEVNEWGEHAFIPKPPAPPTPGCSGWAAIGNITGWQYYNLAAAKWTPVGGSSAARACWSVSALSSGAFTVSR